MADSSRPKISACIVCLNEEDRIRDCLESVKWAGEIVVVDSFSTDNTPEICKEYTDKFYQNKWEGIVKQKNFCIDKTSGEWILFLDADERISPELKADIEKLMEAPDKLLDGYDIPRKTIYFDRWIKHCGWYPNYQLRFFKKSKGRIFGKIPHDHTEVDGAVGKLKSQIIHYTYRDFTDHLRTVNTFSDTAAKEMYDKGKKFSLFNITFRPFLRAFTTYTFKLGFLDGLPGFIISLLSGYYVFSKHIKLYELYRNKKSSGDSK